MKQIKSNIINYVAIIIMGIISSVILLQSCNESYFDINSNEIIGYSNDELLTMSEYDINKIAKNQEFSSEQTNYIAIRYLEIQKNQYYLNLTEKKANDLGISKTEFARMQKEISEVNLLINKWDKEGIDFKLSNPDSIQTDDMKISYNIVRLRSGTEPDERTKSFSINNSYFATSQFFAPSDAKNVSITCSGGGLLTGYNVYVSSYGTTNTGSGVGTLGSWSTILAIPCSNTNCTVGGRTTNSWGGTLRYSW